MMILPQSANSKLKIRDEIKERVISLLNGFE
jgi:hypothetical protein